VLAASDCITGPTASQPLRLRNWTWLNDEQ
jgi:hypothetical protein